MQRRAARVIWRWGPAVVWAAVIFFASASPGLRHFPLPFEWSDKVIHAAVFAFLALLLFNAFWSERRPVGRIALLVVVAASLYGAADEVHQSFIPLRDADVFDWFADAVGAALVSVAVVLCCRRRGRLSSGDGAAGGRIAKDT